MSVPHSNIFHATKASGVAFHLRLIRDDEGGGREGGGGPGVSFIPTGGGEEKRGDDENNDNGAFTGVVNGLPGDF